MVDIKRVRSQNDFNFIDSPDDSSLIYHQNPEMGMDEDGFTDTHSTRAYQPLVTRDDIFEDDED